MRTNPKDKTVQDIPYLPYPVTMVGLVLSSHIIKFVVNLILLTFLNLS
jgi:hypothetical protein